MARKKALWKELGFQVVKSPSGGRKGYIDKSGNYISERQYRSQYAATPMKGSRGYKERQEAKKEGRDFRPVTPESFMRELKEAAKKPGMTLEQFTKGKQPDLAPSDKRILEKRNAFVDEQRREAVKFKRLAGAITEKQAQATLKALERQIKARDKAQELFEKLKKPMPREERIKLEEQYRKKSEQIKKLQNQIEKKGIAIIDDKPVKESLRYGFYHG